MAVLGNLPLKTATSKKDLIYFITAKYKRVTMNHQISISGGIKPAIKILGLFSAQKYYFKKLATQELINLCRFFKYCFSILSLFLGPRSKVERKMNDRRRSISEKTMS